jgi:hypothetical protein
MLLKYPFTCVCIIVDTIRNCWVKTKILSPAQAEDLRAGMRRNNRVAPDESSGLPSDIVDSLSEMVKNMGRKLALPNQPPVSMASVCDLLDLPVERIVEEPPVFDVMEDAEEVCEDDDDATREEFGSSLEVGDIESLPPLSLREARGYAARLMDFVTIN